jgi:hypothetical protein
MKRRIALLMIGTIVGLTACGSQPVAEVPANETQQTETVQEDTQETAEAEESLEAEEEVSYVEDMVLTNDYLTVTVPDEFKGKFLATVDKASISLYDKASNEAGCGGFAFSVVVDVNRDLFYGGMYTKIGEFADAKGEIYDVDVSYPSDVQWDITVSDEMPEDYGKLYESATDIIANAVASGDGTFMYGAGTKGEELYGYLVSQLVEKGGYEDLGFVYKDITIDGVDELLIGPMDGSDGPTPIYEIYTIVNREPALVVSGSADDYYYTEQYGGVTKVTFDGEDITEAHSYTIESGTSELFHQYSIKYDPKADENNPYFVSYGDDENAWEASNQEDFDFREENLKKVLLPLEYTPFSDITPIDYSKVDLSKYETFTKMINDFKPGMGYANEPVGDTDVFIVSSGCYNGENGTQNAIDSSLFVYEGDKIAYIGQVASTGTAYPVSIKDGYIFVGGHHNVFKYTVKDNKLVVAEEASEVFDTNGNSTYYYAKDGAAAEEVKDDSNLTRLFEEYFSGKPVEYAVEK